MHTLHCVLIIVNILFIISYEGVKPTFLVNPKINNDLEDNNHILHSKNQRDASDIYKNNLKLSNEHDGENEVNIVTSLINAWKRKVEQKKANENIKKQKNDEKIILFLYDMESGRLIGRAGTTINNFIENINGKFNGQIITDTQGGQIQNVYYSSGKENQYHKSNTQESHSNTQGGQIQNVHYSSGKENQDHKSNTQESHSSSDRENHDHKSSTQESHSSSNRENHSHKSRTQKSHSSSDRENHDNKSHNQNSYSSSNRENYDHKSYNQKTHSSSDRENHDNKSYNQNSYSSSSRENYDHKSYNQNSYSSSNRENHDNKSYNQNSYSSSNRENYDDKSYTHSLGQYHGYNPYYQYSCGNTYYG